MILAAFCLYLSYTITQAVLCGMHTSEARSSYLSAANSTHLSLFLDTSRSFLLSSLFPGFSNGSLHCLQCHFNRQGYGCSLSARNQYRRGQSSLTFIAPFISASCSQPWSEILCFAGQNTSICEPRIIEMRSMVHLRVLLKPTSNLPTRFNACPI